MHTLLSLLLVGSFVATSGCTLAKMRQESGEMEARIDQKERDLKQVENRHSVLLAERKKLLSELDNKRVTLKELYTGLDRLKKENARLNVENERQQKEQQRVESEIQKFQAEITRLNGDSRLSDHVKRERIDSLKNEIKTYLELMLTL